jgi:hypothetical protein
MDVAGHDPSGVLSVEGDPLGEPIGVARRRCGRGSDLDRVDSALPLDRDVDPDGRAAIVEGGGSVPLRAELLEPFPDDCDLDQGTDGGAPEKPISCTKARQKGRRGGIGHEELGALADALAEVAVVRPEQTVAAVRIRARRPLLP